MTLTVIPRTAMSPAFLAYCDDVLVKEGGAAYTNNPSDRGGPTKYGITQARAWACGYQGDMRELTADQAVTIYWTIFWLQAGLDKINVVSPAIAAELFQLGVNMGAARPAQWLQRLLNSLNYRGTIWQDMKVDGVLGVVTAASLKTYLSRRGAEGTRVMIAGLHALAAVFYITLAEGDESQEEFVFGWLSQRAFPAGK